MLFISIFIQFCVITLVCKHCTDVYPKQHINVACCEHAVSVCVLLCSQNKPCAGLQCSDDV